MPIAQVLLRVRLKPITGQPCCLASASHASRLSNGSVALTTWPSPVKSSHRHRRSAVHRIRMRLFMVSFWVPLRRFPSRPRAHLRGCPARPVWLTKAHHRVRCLPRNRPRSRPHFLSRGRPDRRARRPRYERHHERARRVATRFDSRHSTAQSVHRRLCSARSFHPQRDSWKRGCGSKRLAAGSSAS